MKRFVADRRRRQNVLRRFVSISRNVFVVDSRGVSSVVRRLAPRERRDKHDALGCFKLKRARRAFSNGRRFAQKGFRRRSRAPVAWRARGQARQGDGPLRRGGIARERANPARGRSSRSRGRVGRAFVGLRLGAGLCAPEPDRFGRFRREGREGARTSRKERAGSPSRRRTSPIAAPGGRFIANRSWTGWSPKSKSRIRPWRPPKPITDRRRR